MWTNWFDPHLSVDTPLFVDPLLLISLQDPPWRKSHVELVRHFAKCYELVARGGSVDSLSAQLALRLLTFPEPSEFCLGYTAAGTPGVRFGPRVCLPQSWTR